MPHSNCSSSQAPVTSFSTHPIGTIATLARMLHLSLPDLQHIRATANAHYRIAKKERKKDGTTRICYDALPPLKTIQARIQCLLLNTVTFPQYLQGGIKDHECPRGQAANARLHLRKQSLVTEDIQRFFPTVHRSIIFEIWHHFFRFPPKVAEVLTALTTKDGYLPQGAKTSTLLANLVFWDCEPSLVATLEAQGIQYSRLIDDITVSSHSSLSHQGLSSAIASINAMVRAKGLRLKRPKQTIAHAGARMVTTQLVVNAKTSLRHEERSSIRAAVARTARTLPAQRHTTRYEREYRRTLGRVGYLRQHNAREAAALLEELQRAKPLAAPAHQT